MPQFSNYRAKISRIFLWNIFYQTKLYFRGTPNTSLNFLIICICVVKYKKVQNTSTNHFGRLHDCRLNCSSNDGILTILNSTYNVMKWKWIFKAWQAYACQACHACHACHACNACHALKKSCWNTDENLVSFSYSFLFHHVVRRVQNNQNSRYRVVQKGTNSFLIHPVH